MGSGSPESSSNPTPSLWRDNWSLKFDAQRTKMDYRNVQQSISSPHVRFDTNQPFRRHSSQHISPHSPFPQSRSSQSTPVITNQQPATALCPGETPHYVRRNSQPGAGYTTHTNGVIDQFLGTATSQHDHPSVTSNDGQNIDATSSLPGSTSMLAGFDVLGSYTPADLYRPSNNNEIHVTRADMAMNQIANSWDTKAIDTMEFPSLDSELGLDIFGANDGTVIDMRHLLGSNFEDGSALDSNQRRISESSFSMSSYGTAAEMPTFEDFSRAESYPQTSTGGEWNDVQASTSLLSPVPSPRRIEPIRTNNRSKMAPSSHSNMRASPYTVDRNRLKRWSAGAGPLASTSAPSSVSPSPMSYAQDQFAAYGGPRSTTLPAVPLFGANGMGNYSMPAQHQLYNAHHHSHPHHDNGMFYSNPDQSYALGFPRPVPSQGLFRLLQSNADRHGGCHTHFADLSDPPDLYSSLQEEPSNPPESDMHPDDPDMVPHEQDLRFKGDLYTPRWVRGHGNKREGWCGLCKEGRWLVLKNSAFWYDKSFTHGVSAATGAAFQGPQETRRTEGNLDVWEGLCGSCGEWIALVSSKKKGTTWFRHAYKCHTHQKVKDGPKRRRETSQQIRARTVSSASTTASSAYPVSKESSYDSPMLQEKSSPAETKSDPGVSSGRDFYSVIDHSGHLTPSITSSGLVGRGGTKSIIAGMPLG